MTIASIDIGTNTILLLIAEVDKTGMIRALHQEQRLPRLGQNVDASGNLSVAVFDRVSWILKEYLSIAAQFGAHHVFACATSAVRDARNKEEFLTYVRTETGLAVEVISGEDEAAYTYLGATSNLRGGGAELCVLDIGGGSTELTFASSDKSDRPEVLRRFSFQIGAVRLTERFLKNRPPHLSELRAANELIRREIEILRSREFQGYKLVGVAGTLTTLACLDQQLPEFDVERVSGYELTSDRVQWWCGRLSGMIPAEVAALSAAAKGREDILAAGVLILRECMEAMKFRSVTVSERGLRYGYAIHRSQLMQHSAL